MKFSYYPGCSLHGACRPYDRSLKQVMAALGHELEEVRDWNCCGATVYMSVRETVALSISARNLSLARQMGHTLMAPCSACYTTLLKTQRYLREVPRLRRDVTDALAEAGLPGDVAVRVRHPLDVIVNEIGLEAVARRARRRLDGLRVAPYYGCMIVRPEQAFDDRDWPTGMDNLFNGLGAECVYFPDRVRCCGGMLATTHPEVGNELAAGILECAVRNGAEAIVTTCPLCHINLESHQPRGKGADGEGGPIPVLFFTQLLGIAFGIPPEDLDLHRGLTPLGRRLGALAGVAA
ncbi:MAG TPA: CoB--CoM heterodisulfide reductase iron-sulfur subunit B family protein [Candidatus Eisenbacteria bacterium]|jgi:heterodisulfide reductase subunit B